MVCRVWIMAKRNSDWILDPATSEGNVRHQRRLDNSSPHKFHVLWRNLCERAWLFPPLILSSALGVVIASLRPTGLAVIPLFGCVLLMLNSAGVLIWNLGRWSRARLRGFWKKQTPPHEASFNAFSSLLLVDTIGRFFVGWRVSRLDQPEGDVSTSLTYGISQFILGTVAVLIGLFIQIEFGRALIENGTFDALTAQSMTSLTAVISVLLGPVVGLLSLATLSFANDTDSLLLFISMLAIPSVFMAPCAQNLTRCSQVFHHEVIFRENDREDWSSRVTFWATVCALIWLAMMVYIIHYIYVGLIA